MEKISFQGESFFLLKASLHNHTDQQGVHRQGYPVEFLLSLLQKEKFDVAAITDHSREDSRKSFALARKDCPQNLLLLPGFEDVIQDAHVVSLLFQERKKFQFFCHPYRTFQNDWTDKLAAFRKRCQAVELDQIVSSTPELASRYQELATKIPVLATADFHSDYFALKNFFTVAIARENTISGFLSALKNGDLIAFYPDIVTWKRKFIVSSGPAARAFLSQQKRNSKIFQISPQVPPPRMTTSQIKEYWQSSLVTLTSRYSSVSLLPEIGGQIVSFLYRRQQIFSPVFPTFLETPQVFASYPTFESNFSPWVIPVRSKNALTMQYQIKNPPWQGLLLKREIVLKKDNLWLRLWKQNPTTNPISFAGNISLILLKNSGEESTVEIREPKPFLGEKTPLRTLRKVEGASSVKIKISRSKLLPVVVTCQAVNLAEIHLWDNLSSLRSLICFYFQQEVIPAGGESQPCVIGIQPCQS